MSALYSFQPIITFKTFYLNETTLKKKNIGVSFNSTVGYSKETGIKENMECIMILKLAKTK